MSTFKEMSESKLTLTIIPKDTIASSIIKSTVNFSFLGLCIFVSYGNAWWTLVTGILFILMLWAKVNGFVNKVTTTFNTKEEAIDFLNKYQE